MDPQIMKSKLPISRSFITSAETLLPCKVTVTGPREWDRDITRNGAATAVTLDWLNFA